MKNSCLQLTVVEEPTTSPRGHNAPRTVSHTEALLSDLGGPSKNHDGSGAHVLFLSNDRRDALAGIVGERLLGSLKPIIPRAGLGGRHRRRQVDEPVRV